MMKRVSCIGLIIALLLGGIYLYHTRELTRVDLKRAFKNISKLGIKQNLVKNKYIETENKTQINVGGKYFDLLLFQLNGVYNQELGYSYRFDIDSSVFIGDKLYQPVDFIPIDYLYYIKENI